MNIIKSDVLIIGSGGAALRAAILARESGDALQLLIIRKERDKMILEPRTPVGLSF